MRKDYAVRAQALVGARYRHQGRREDGLDCVGLVLLVYEIDAEQVRRDYMLRGDYLSELRTALAGHFRRIPRRQLRPGDLLLFQPAATQLHLAVQTSLGIVHAHAGIRRVVEAPGTPEWPLLGVYRKRERY